MSKLVIIVSETERVIVLKELVKDFGKREDLEIFKNIALPVVLDYDEEKLWLFKEDYKEDETNNLTYFMSWFFDK